MPCPTTLTFVGVYGSKFRFRRTSSIFVDAATAPAPSPQSRMGSGKGERYHRPCFAEIEVGVIPIKGVIPIRGAILARG